MYFLLKIFWVKLDMKSKKVYVYVIIVIWNIIRAVIWGRKGPQGLVPDRKQVAGRIDRPGRHRAAAGPESGREPKKSNKPRSDEKDF